MQRAGRVVVLRALGLGDFLTAVPAYRALRRAFPEHRITLAAPAGIADLAALSGGIDDVVGTPRLTSFRWRGAPPDLAVNLHGRGPQSHQALLDARPRRIVAFAAAGVTGPEWVAKEHEVARWCRLLTESGIPADPADLRLQPPRVDAPVPGAVVVHPGAAYGSKRWPATRFALVAAELAREGYPVVLTGSAQERALALRVARQAGLPPGCVLAGRTGLLDLAALVGAARLVVCGDTGISHLATAYGTPSVVLFGPVSPDRWGPPPSPRHRALWAGGGRDPWAAEPDPALLAIGVDEVLTAAHEVLSARAKGRRRRNATTALT